MKTKDDVLERIKKLMALSHSANPNEAAVALSQAQKLMMRNHLTVKAFHQARHDHSECLRA